MTVACGVTYYVVVDGAIFYGVLSGNGASSFGTYGWVTGRVEIDGVGVKIVAYVGVGDGVGMEAGVDSAAKIEATTAAALEETAFSRVEEAEEICTVG